MIFLKEFFSDLRYLYRDGVSGKILIFLMSFICSFFILGLPFFIYKAQENKKTWDAFLVEHHCKEIGFMSGGYKTSAKTGYLCDDGKQYWL